MFEGRFLNYPQANTQPDFPKCHTSSQFPAQSSGFPNRNQLQLLHTDDPESIRTPTHTPYS